MCSALFDDNRRTWTREDWEQYNKKDLEFSNRFKNAVLNKSLNEIEALVEEGKSYYHFPDIDDLQIHFSSQIDFDYFISIVKLKELFYTYDTIN